MDMDFANKNIVFLGIGGISMSALARLCKNFKANVFGTDIQESANTLSLKKDKIAKIKIGNSPSFIRLADIVVYTNAIPKNNLDLILAKKLNKPLFERATLLGIISCKYKNVIAVSGTHGKTTTTALLGWIFNKSKAPSTTHIGGISNNFNSNININGFKYFITEACEYKKSFLHLNPNTTIINNIELDHPDCFKNLNDVNTAFIQLSKQTKDLLILNGDSLNLSTFKHKNTLTFGLNTKNTIYANNIKTLKASTTFDVVYKNEFLGRVKTSLLGKHNIYNILGAMLTALNYNINFNVIQSAINSFKGTKRRLERLNTSPSIYLDYAHHPSEIKATISSLKANVKGKLIAVFQPHTYSRTLALIKEFSTCFLGVSNLYILPTYPAREKEILGGRAIDLFYSINNVDVQYVSNPQSLVYLLSNINKEDTILFLGAGSIDNIAKSYVKSIIKSK